MQKISSFKSVLASRAISSVDALVKMLPDQLKNEPGLGTALLYTTPPRNAFGDIRAVRFGCVNTPKPSIKTPSLQFYTSESSIRATELRGATVSVNNDLVSAPPDSTANNTCLRTEARGGQGSPPSATVTRASSQQFRERWR